MTGEENKVCAHAALDVDVIQLVNKVRGETSTEQRVRRGVRMLVGIGHLGIE